MMEIILVSHTINHFELYEFPRLSDAPRTDSIRHNRFRAPMHRVEVKKGEIFRFRNGVSNIRERNIYFRMCDI